MNMITFATPWLASVRPAAAVPGIRFRTASATRAQSPSLMERGYAASGLFAGTASHGIPAYLPVFTDRPMGDEQTKRNRVAHGGVRRPRYAWREPVTT